MGSSRSAINELKEHGYLKAEQKKVNGKFAEMIYTIIENPNSPLNEIPHTEKPHTEKPHTENCNLQNTNDVQSTNEQKNSGKPKTEFQIVVDAYFQNFKNLYEQKKVNAEKPIVNMKVAGNMINRLLSEIGKDKILMALDRAILDDWIVSQGYSITTILSANQLNKLLNGKPQTSQKQNKTVNLGNRDFFSEN
jgi:hypothetical protein